VDIDVISHARRIATRNLAKRGAASLTDADRVHEDTELAAVVGRNRTSFSSVYSAFPQDEVNGKSTRINKCVEVRSKSRLWGLRSWH
jgi:hypothetical protein